MKEVILTGIGFVVGVGEALIYYNMGQSSGENYKFKIPPTKEFLKTAGMVLVTSLVTTALFKGIELVMDEADQRKQLALKNKDTKNEKI
jgi:hypothetical protein